MVDIHVIIFMGVSGCGKSTAALQASQQLGGTFVEGDEFHPKENILKMKQGKGLTDTDRIPWLNTLIEHVKASTTTCFVACSCLKKSFRDLFRREFHTISFVLPIIPRNILEQRLRQRKGHFATETLLDSQFKDFEKPDFRSEVDVVMYDPEKDNLIELVSRIVTFMLQPDLTSSKSSSFPITPDGGIVKIPLLEKPGGSKINWIRGMNAQFYYTAHAYIIPQEHDNKDHSDHCSTGCSHSQKDKDELLKKKVELMQQLLDLAKSIIISHVEKKKKEEIPVTMDPSKKPVRTLISNSTQNDPNPFDLRIGYSFSVTAMEICVKSLKVGEKARFLCMPEYCEGFMQLETVMRQERINKKLKDEGKPPISVSGCCAHASPELLEITRGLEPAIGAPLEFEIHLVGVQNPNSFQKQIWEMEPLEKYQEIPLIKSQGGQEYKKGDYSKALEKYERCLVLLESLSTSSIILDLKKQDMDLKRGVVYESIIPPDNKIELDVFNQLFTTCRLNYAACQLKLKNYNSVIEQCSLVLKTEPGNPKALFRRGQAYVQNGMHLDLAERDLSSLESLLDIQSVEYGECQKWKRVLQQKMELYHAKERKMYGSMFSQ